MCMGLFGSCTKVPTHENPEDQSVKCIYPKYMFDDVQKKTPQNNKNHAFLGFKDGQESAPV